MSLQRFVLAALAAFLFFAGCADKPADPVTPAADASTAETTPPTPPPPVAVPWVRLPPPEIPTDRPLRAGFLVVDGVYNSELMAPYDIFQHTIFHIEPGIEVFTVSPDGEAIVTFEGLTLVPHHSFADVPPIDILVVPSAENSMGSDLDNQEMIDWVNRVGEQADFVISLCDGAFVLAQAGLLDGRAATTFPSDQDAFAERFTSVDLHREPSFVVDGPMVTSQGGAKSYDPAMYLVDHLYGEDIARRVGRGLIIAWPPTAETMPAHVVPPSVAAE
ncbi:MAG: DJ-1/PfpI family protein [Acidobacteriota bacterium]